MIIYISKNFKYNVKNKFIYYNKELDNFKVLIKITIKFDNKIYKLIIKI